VLDVLAREGEELLPLAAIEDRHLVASRERHLDRLRSEKPGAAEDENPFLHARVGASAASFRQEMPSDAAEIETAAAASV